MRTIERLLYKAKRPLIIAGGGIRQAKAVAEFREFVDNIKIPVVTSLMGFDLLPATHPLYIGHGGTKGQRSANMVIQKADLILVLGSRLSMAFIGHEPRLFAKRAYKVVVDVDKREHSKKTIKIDLFVKCDVKAFIKRMDKVSHHRLYDLKWLKKCQEIKEKYFDFKDKGMYEYMYEISRLSREGDTFIFDTGCTAFIASQSLRLKENQRAIIAGATLTMGYNLPAVVGVWAAHPQGRIICITGDGSIQSHIHELQTIVHHKIPAKIFVTNNGGYLAIRHTQNSFFNKRLIGESAESGISFPSFKKIAYAYGIHYTKSIIEAMSYQGTVICELDCPHWQRVLSCTSFRNKHGKLQSLPIDKMVPQIT